MNNHLASNVHIQLEEAAYFILNHDDFLVVSHIQPDGDAASSTYAMGWMLQQLNKTFLMINENKMPDKFNYLWGNDQVITLSQHSQQKKYQCVISLDCGDFSRIGQVSTLFHENYELLNIDHHITNNLFGTHPFVDTQAAATVQLLYALLHQLKLAPSLAFNECIYTGLSTDTGGFRYANTTPIVMQIAADLLNMGVQGPDITQRVLESYSKTQLLLLQKTLPTLQFAYQDRIAWISVARSILTLTQATSEDLEGLVQYPRNVEGVQVGLLFKEIEENQIKVSFRSHHHVDVSKIAQSFGGGGHQRAAGSVLHGNLEDVVARVIEITGKELV